MKILIVKLGSIGDIIHTLPVLAAIRSELPYSEISWVAEVRSAEIIRGNMLIDHLIEVDTRSLRSANVVAEILPRLREQFRDLRRNKFDIAIDLQGLLKSAAIAKLSGAKIRYGFERNELREPASRIFLNRTAAVPTGTHVVRKNLSLAAAALQISVPNKDFEFPIYTGPEHAHAAERLIDTAGGSFAILNPGGGWLTKLWPAGNYGILADMLWDRFGLTSIIATGPNEGGIAAEAATASRTGKAIVAQPGLKEFFELSKLSSLYVGGDTGPTHLAIAAGTPVVGIFGPTEWWRNGSTNPADICVERLDIGCRVNCHRRTCTNWICLDISVETVLGAVAKRLAKQIDPPGI